MIYMMIYLGLAGAGGGTGTRAPVRRYSLSLQAATRSWDTAH